MYGLDRACIFVDVKTDILYVRERIKIMFPYSFSESLTNYMNNYKIDKKNINYIKLEEKKLKRITTIKIDFSYPRFFSEDNIYSEILKLPKEMLENVTLTADEHLEYGYIVEVMSKLRNENVKNVSLNIQKNNK